jgi:hypothetical protein
MCFMQFVRFSVHLSGFLGEHLKRRNYTKRTKENKKRAGTDPKKSLSGLYPPNPPDPRSKKPWPRDTTPQAALQAGMPAVQSHPPAACVRFVTFRRQFNADPTNLT